MSVKNRIVETGIDGKDNCIRLIQVELLQMVCQIDQGSWLIQQNELP